jgi:hypothetical protein
MVKSDASLEVLLSVIPEVIDDVAQVDAGLTERYVPPVPEVVIPGLVSDIAEIEPTAEYDELPYPVPVPVMIY